MTEEEYKAKMYEFYLEWCKEGGLDPKDDDNKHEFLNQVFSKSSGPYDD